MSFQDTNHPANPPNGGLEGLKEQGLSAAENQISGAISEKLDNPLVHKIVENKDTIKKVVKDLPGVDEQYPEGNSSAGPTILMTSRNIFQKRPLKTFWQKRTVRWCTVPLPLTGKISWPKTVM